MSEGKVRKKAKRRWWQFWGRAEASEAPRAIAYDRAAVETGTLRTVDAPRKSPDETGL